MTRPIQVDLVFPPLTGIAYPYLSTAVLAAYVHDRSVHRVKQVDLNLRFVQHQLTTHTLEANIAAAEARVRELDRRAVNGQEQVEYGRCARLVNRRETIVDGLPAALSTIRDATEQDPRTLDEAYRIVRWALDAATAVRPPERYDFTEPVYRYSSGSPAELRAGLADRDNGFFDFYDRAVSADMLRGDVVGISLVYRGQVLPALTLAAWLRRARPDARILVGGPLLTALRAQLRQEAWLFDFVDTVVLYEGEATLLEYLEQLGRGVAVPVVPNTVYRDEDGEVRTTARAAPVAAAELPTPDFDGLPLAEYLAPAVTLPVLASRGCYWRCAFCTHHHIYGDTYRPRPRSAIVDDLAKLTERYDCRNFYFVDESISPKLLRHLSSSVLESGLGIRWGCELRMERSLTRSDFDAAFAAGCRVFSFGMESASQRVLDLMNKGIKRVEIDRIVAECHRSGIRIHVMCIIGFPGETEAEALETIGFVEQHSRELDIAGFSYFCLNRSAPVQLQPDKFGVTGLRELVPGHTFEERLAYDVEAGLDRRQAFRLWEQALRSPGVQAVLGRVGHAERERFLYAVEGRMEVRTRPPTDRGRQSSISVSSRSHSLSGAYAAADAFLPAAGYAYNVEGIGLGDSWQRLRRSSVLRAEADYLYVPSADVDFEIGEQLRDALVRLTESGPEAELTPPQAAALAHLRDLWAGQGAPLA
ncbi:radical SAM protein [Actinoplanes sp. NPDC048791]|uniref:B12-binding domain-containing radical SAM protein n=1 Tax=Actinoplanes sp. NPDC048791 TaxID=3154623 RepID=UPI0033CC2F67